MKKKIKLSTLALEADVISSIDGLRKVIGGDGEYGSLPTTQAGFDYAFANYPLASSPYVVNLGPSTGGGGIGFISYSGGSVNGSVK